MKMGLEDGDNGQGNNGTLKKVLMGVCLFVAMSLVVVIALAIHVAADVKKCTEFPNQQQTFNEILTRLRAPHLPNTWQQIFPLGDSPPPRLAHAACSIGNKMYIHGGMYGFANISMNDMWVYDESMDNWQIVRTTGDIPSPRLHHSMQDIDDRTILMFGGFNVFNTQPEHTGLNDFYKFDIIDKKWTRLDTTITGAAPGIRGAHETTWYDGNFYIFGGFATIGATGHSPDLWRYSPKTNKWTLMAAAPTPTGRIGFSWVVVGDSAYLYGGGCQETGQCDDNWKYTFATNKWTQLFPAKTPGSRRASHADTAVNGIIYLYGGTNIAVVNGSPVVTMLDDLWAYDALNARWLEMVPNFGRGNRPPAAFGHSVVRINEKVVVFGGRITAANSPGSNMLWEYHTLIPY